MAFIDSHCHLHDHRIASDLEKIIGRATDAGIEFMVTCATMEENFDRTALLAETWPGVLPFFGVHPWFIDSLSSGWKARLEACLSGMPSGVGETGLDFMIKNADRDRQVQVFETQLALAVEMKRPINIHIRKAWEPLIRILKRFGPLKIPGLVHSYSGSADMVPVLEKYGLYISFSGSVTNPNSNKVLKSLAAVSADRIVFETDSPDIPPWISGERISGLNEPSNLPGIAGEAARRLETDPGRFIRRAYENSRALFNPVIGTNANEESS